jgi:hypothetical protein
VSFTILSRFTPPIACASVCNANAERGAPTIGRLFRGCQFPSRGFLLGVDDGDPGAAESLAPLSLIQGAAQW